MKFRITRIAAYLYTKRQTLSFSWRCRWTWKPERFSLPNDGWNWWWGWFCIERNVWDEDDAWGEEATNQRLEVWEMIADELLKDGAS